MKHLIFPVALLVMLALSGCQEDTICTCTDPQGFEDISGAWIRVESNNPSADGMIVKLVGTSGVIIDKAGSGFSNGDVKWQGVVLIGENSFDYKELGSDGNYYDAKMTYGSDDTLRIMVGSSGAGNEQKWVHDGEYIPGQNGPSVTQELSGSISEARTLKNGPAAVDYEITDVLDVREPLTIEPGTVIEMAENAGIGIYDAGSLKMIGTETDPIIIRGAQQVQGYWRGIHIETNSANNRFEHVQISDAGSNYVYCCNDVATLFMKGGRIFLSDVQLKNGNGIGLAVGNGTAIDKFENIRIESHADYPISTNPTDAGQLQGSGIDLSGNDKDMVFISRGKVDEATTWGNPGIPYEVEGYVIDVTARLSIDAGTELVFQENAGLGVYDAGALSVNGTSGSPVIMRGDSDLRGIWRGIHMETNSASNVLRYLELSNAGANYVYCCNEVASIMFKNGSATMENCTISDGAGYGIVGRGDFAFNNYESNTITGHAKEPLLMTFNALNGLDGAASSYTGNDLDFIVLSENSLTEELTLREADVPYTFEGGTVIDVRAQLNLEAGVEFAFSENSGLGVYDSGVIKANGTSANKVVLQGKVDVRGYWRGIHTETNGGNVIRYATIRNAGSNYVYCCNPKAALMVKNGAITVEKSTITENDGCGIFVSSGASLQDVENNINNNTDGNICN